MFREENKVLCEGPSLSYTLREIPRLQGKSSVVVEGGYVKLRPWIKMLAKELLRA